MPKLVWLNGVISPLESAVTSVADHAHLYGDGLFEGIRIYDSRIFKLDEHLDRAYHGIQYLGYEMKMTKAENGVWSYTTDTLKPGYYQYWFEMDGLGMPDPVNTYVRTASGVYKSQ